MVHLVMNLDNDLTKVSTAREILQCLLALVEVKYPINDRTDLMLLAEFQHFLEAIPGTIQQAFKREVLLDGGDIDVGSLFWRVDFA